MNTLLQLLTTFPYNHYADSRSIQRRQAYYKDGRIWSLEVSENQAICEVNGDNSDYTVIVEIDKKSSCFYKQAIGLSLCLFGYLYKMCSPYSFKISNMHWY